MKRHEVRALTTHAQPPLTSPSDVVERWIDGRWKRDRPEFNSLKGDKERRRAEAKTFRMKQKYVGLSTRNSGRDIVTRET